MATEKGAKQRDLIMNVAASLFWEKGFDGTSIRDIARACGFETSNLYYYFPTKEDILFSVVYQEVKKLIDSIESLELDGDLSPVERLKLLIRIHIQQTLQSERSPYRMLPDVAIRSLSKAHRTEFIRARDTYDHIVRKIIRAGIASKDFAEVDEKLAGLMLASAIIRSRIWFDPNGEYSADEIADFIFNLMLNGLRGDKQHETPCPVQAVSASLANG